MLMDTFPYMRAQHVPRQELEGGDLVCKRRNIHVGGLPSSEHPFVPLRPFLSEDRKPSSGRGAVTELPKLPGVRFWLVLFHRLAFESTTATTATATATATAICFK
jgi:hypothetical protein